MLVTNGATDVTTYFVLRDSTNHAPKTDVTITDIDLYYVEELAAISTKADATAHTNADDAHSDNKAFHIGQGLYRIDWPDAAFDGGVGKKVILIVVCTGVDTTFLEVELSPGQSELVEGTVTLQQAMRLLLAVNTGKSSGGGTTTVVFRDIGDTKNRISATVDSNGNRTAVGTRDGT